MQLSLKFKFLASTISLIILGMGISTIVSVTNSQNTIERISQEQQVQFVDLTLRQVDSWIRGRTLEMMYWGKLDVFNVAIDGAFIKMANTELAGLKKDYDFYEILNVVNPQGEVVASSDPDQAKSIHADGKTFFQEALKGNVFVSDVTTSSISGKPVFIISAPVKRDDQTVGALFGVVDLGYFNKNFVIPVKFGKTGHIFIIGASGLVLAHPDSTAIMKLDMNQHDFGKEILQNKAGVIQFTYQGKKKAAAYKTSNTLKWTVVASADTSEITAPGRALSKINVIIALCVIALAVLIIFYISRTI